MADRIDRVGRLVYTIPAGLVDAGCASVASFSIGFVAVRILDPSLLGVYALHFSAFVAASVLPTQLIFKPAEVKALSSAHWDRSSIVTRTFRLAIVPATIAAFLSLAAVIAAPPALRTAGLVPLTTTSMACVIVSPYQDHVRRVLHLAGHSWCAAVVSATHFVGTVLSLLVLAHLPLPALCLPFGALLVANILSFTLGILLIAHFRQGHEVVGITYTNLADSGRWLLLLGILPTASTFVSAVLVARIVGADLLGYAEAARVVAQPLFVLAMGISAVTAPQSMASGAKRDLREATRVARVFVVVNCALGLVYLGIFGFSWHGNPLANLVPNAFVISGLAAVSILANVVQGLSFPWRSELLGGRHERRLVRIELIGNTCRVGAATASSILQSFSLAVGLTALALIRLIGYRHSRSQLFVLTSSETAVPPRSTAG